MIIDFHVHWVPSDVVRDRTKGQDVAVRYEGGVPTYIFHPRLGNLAQHVETMDEAGIDISVLSCGVGFTGTLDDRRRINDRTKEILDKYPGRFVGLAHIPPLGGDEAFRELARAARDLGFKGVAIESDVQGVTLDSRELWPFYRSVQELGLYVFVHPSLKALGIDVMQDYDLARSVGREFGLVMATIRLIDGGVFDEFPRLRVHMSHLGGGIAALLGRIRSYQDKVFWGTAGNERHGRLPKRPLDDYFANLFFDTGGFCGEVNAVRAALLEIPSSQILFGSDYPQEIRSGEAVRTFIQSIEGLDVSADVVRGILADNGRHLIGV
ncbi:MAG: amidohydrolase family protein [Chloroflexi bacterium]|nr:amidohydrolase family protein [Chloroflexota bacterium]